MRTRSVALCALLCILCLVPLLPAAAQAPTSRVKSRDVYAEISGDTIVLGNGVIERTWDLESFESKMTDKRTGLTTTPTVDFMLHYWGFDAELTSSHAGGISVGTGLTYESASARELPEGGVELTVDLVGPAGINGVTRTYTAYPGIAGYRVDTTTSIPGNLTAYSLDRVGVEDASSEIHAFSAGYDWRGSDTPDWEPALNPFGGAHTGDHRETKTAGPGESNEGEGEWMSFVSNDGSRAFMVAERVDYASTRMEYSEPVGEARVDLAHDLIYVGPFESDIHLGNPEQIPVRSRVIAPGDTLALEPVFTGMAIDADDEPWQHYAYLERHRMPDWSRAVVFNSNGVDSNRISTGAKDDMDLAEVQRQAAVARELGVEIFVLDDGWQARSGDWCPDSPQCPEPRWDGTEASKFKPRFPDATFEAVRAELGNMRLGLWMSPMHFNPASDAYESNPQWNCEPLGEALVAYNRADPNSSSNEAGLGTWNPEATGPDGKLIDYIEGRIRNAIENWGVAYFKFDFMAWIDCAGVDPVTAYDYRESFIRMLDRLIADHPTTTFQIDETNDYRLFPFESVARGPSWYANGGPKAHEALHNLWILNPYVPGYTLGQQTLGNGRGTLSTDYLMATALGSHMTFFTDLTSFTPEQIEVAARWTDLYRENRDRFATFTYPLLDDPISGDNWTALQPWDADETTGALLVFRQDAVEDVKSVSLRGIRGDGSYVLTEAMSGEIFGTFSGSQLRDGIAISLPQRHSAAVFFIDPAPPAEVI